MLIVETKGRQNVEVRLEQMKSLTLPDGVIEKLEEKNKLFIQNRLFYFTDAVWEESLEDARR